MDRLDLVMCFYSTNSIFTLTQGNAQGFQFTCINLVLTRTNSNKSLI